MFYQLDSRKIISVNGADKFSFLQGLITNDIRLLEEVPCIYTLMLTPNGRYLYDFFIWNENGLMMLDVEAQFADTILKKLNMYKLRSDVELKIEDDFYVYSFLVETEGGSIDPRMKSLGYRLVIDEMIEGAWLEEHFANRCWEKGVPYHSQDMIPEKSIPLEWSMDSLNAIAWDKGCYMGQELTARTKHQGIVRKIACPVEVKGQGARGDEIFAGEQKVGKLQSNRDGKGFALLEIEVLQSGKKEFTTANNAVINLRLPSWIENILATKS